MKRSPLVQNKCKTYSVMILISLFIIFMGISACGVHIAGGRKLTPSVYYTLESGNSWHIFQHTKGEWTYGPSFFYLKDDFSTKDLLLIDSRCTNNAFLAEYSDSSSRVVIYVATGGYEPRQGVKYDIFDNVIDTNLYDNSDSCKELDVKRITVAFTPIDMMFDSGSVKFEVKGQIIQGDEIATPVYGMLSKAKKYPPQTYNLSTLRYSERFEPVLGGGNINRDFNHPTFSYRFNLTCRDIENSIFIIDGLSSNEKKVPPLKVRIRYYDFSKVPSYDGASTKGTINSL